MAETSQRTFRLRPLEKADLADVQRWFQDVQDIALFDRACRIPPNQAQTEHMWEDALSGAENPSKCWFVIETDRGVSQGVIGFEGISSVNRDAVVALFVDKSARGCGAGIRAAALLVDFGFRQLGLNRITSYCRADNKRSLDLLRALNFEPEGTMRQAWFADGQFHDIVVVGLLQQDWAARRGSLAQELGSETVVSFGSGGCPAWSWPPKEGEGN
ncbi:GNAT family N-acetyltransferase [Ruegeria sp.]|uniref:GNAT family N-acetyltransferase n=1 Tax=Ruegeria sp. TaxID=1879320 RepID=UPI003C7E9558